MAKTNLTEQELGWLLTQEARGAADRLRDGFRALKINDAPGAPSGPEGGGLEASLEALDDAMSVLSSLHEPSLSRSVRKRVDLAAVVLEFAPEARVVIEPGQGTEVFGDEQEFRRMVHVLLHHGSASGGSVTVRGDGKEVKVSVVLGPDSAAVSDVERVWLNRMSQKLAGRYELDGRSEVLALPAEGHVDREEKNALRKELREARLQGETYARELAAILTHRDRLAWGAEQRAAAGARVSAVRTLSASVASELRDREGEELASSVRSLLPYLELTEGLVPAEPSANFSLAEMVRDRVNDLRPAADARQVTLEHFIDAKIYDSCWVYGLRGAARTLVWQVVRRAIVSSNPGGRVVVSIALSKTQTGGTRPELIVEDDGGGETASSAVGIGIARELAQAVQANLVTAPHAIGTRVTVIFPAVIARGDA